MVPFRVFSFLGKAYCTDVSKKWLAGTATLEIRLPFLIY
jgi:hypothetical protein